MKTLSTFVFEIKIHKNLILFFSIFVILQGIWSKGTVCEYLDFRTWSHRYLLPSGAYFLSVYFSATLIEFEYVRLD